VLQVHLDKEHHEEYIRVCEENGWKNQLLSCKKPAEGSVNLEQMLGLQTQFCTPWSWQTFLEYLVDFIVMSDQVSMPLCDCIYQANFTCSQSMLLSVQNFVDFFYIITKSSKIVAACPDKPK